MRALRNSVVALRGEEVLPNWYFSARIVHRCKVAGSFALSVFSRSLKALGLSKRRGLISIFWLEITRAGCATGNHAPRIARVRVPVSPKSAPWCLANRRLMYFLALTERRLNGLLKGTGQVIGFHHRLFFDLTRCVRRKRS